MGDVVNKVLSPITGSGAAADAAREGARLSAGATAAATEKNIDFQKWLWGEQKDLAQPYADMGSSAISAYMQELGFTGTDKPLTTFDKPRPTAPDYLAESGGLGGFFSNVKNQTAKDDYKKELAAWEAERDAFVGKGGTDWSRTPGAGGFTAEDMYKDPGYQFGLSEGTKARETSASARGMQLSGATQKALTRFGTDYASTKYNEAFNRRQAGLDNLYRMITSGQAAAAGQSAAGGQMGSQVSSSIAEGGRAKSQMYSDIGNIGASEAMSGWNTMMDVGNVAASYYGAKAGATPKPA